MKIYAGFAYATNISIEMTRAGTYLIRVNNKIQRVNVN